MTTYRSMSEAWRSELSLVANGGDRIIPRGMPTRELMFREFEIVLPLSFPVKSRGREFRDVIGVLEGLSMVAQTSIPTTFTDRIRKFGEFQDDGIFWGAYGARLHGQIGDVVRRLQADPDTRQAVLTLFDGGRDLAAAKRDIPCTVSIQFMKRFDELNMKVNMRSNDLWLGTPYDLTQFAILQATVAQAIGTTPGTYVHAAGSLHLYDRDLEKAQAVLDEFKETNLGLVSFPLWSADTLEGIVGRAQRLLVSDAEWADMTPFERWAHDLLWTPPVTIGG